MSGLIPPEKGDVRTPVDEHDPSYDPAASKSRDGSIKLAVAILIVVGLLAMLAAHH